MKAEFINPFIEASRSVIKALCSIDIQMGKIYLKTSPLFVNQAIILIGVLGKIKGQVCFELSIESAKKLASIMMGGMPVTELDELSRSAVAEMGNMIMGNATALLESNDLHIDITPPTLIIGERLEVSYKHKTIVVPLELAGIGNMNINVTVEDVG